MGNNVVAADSLKGDLEGGKEGGEGDSGKIGDSRKRMGISVQLQSSKKKIKKTANPNFFS